MSAMASSSGNTAPIARTRTLFAILAAIVVFDAAVLRAPFLAFIAVPFVVATWRYRQHRPAATGALLLCCSVYVAIGVAYAVANGLHAPLEPGSAGPRPMISPGDFAFVYLGTPIAFWLAVRLLRGLVRPRATSPEMVAA